MKLMKDALMNTPELIENVSTLKNRIRELEQSGKESRRTEEVLREHQDEIICVLTDLTMPHMNGWETLTALRKLAPDFPVILTSGYNEAHVMQGDHPDLPQVFLGKPYKLKGLRDAIGQALINKK
jgi:FixJ family two-component response regulator